MIFNGLRLTYIVGHFTYACLTLRDLDEDKVEWMDGTQEMREHAYGDGDGRLPNCAI